MRQGWASDERKNIYCDYIFDESERLSRRNGKVIDIACRLQREDTVVFSVRDHGPGVPKDQLKKIFRLCYRSTNEITRETVGRGIGLALVHQLALSMNGQVDVLSKEPGAEFRISFPASSKRHPAGADARLSPVTTEQNDVN